MSYKVTIDLSGMERIVSNIPKAQATLVEQIREGSTPFVPVDTGSLQGSVTCGTNEVTWNEDYAAYVYFGTSRMKGRPWVEQAAALNLAFWTNKTLEALMGGR